jgi:serine/threonine protein kinase
MSSSAIARAKGAIFRGAQPMARYVFGRMLSAGPGVGRFGPYTISRLLGRGGSADVFEARHVARGDRVALKILRTMVNGDHASVLQVIREARAAMTICHPNVVQIYDAGVENRVPYIVMELLGGEDLACRLERSGPLAIATTIDLLLPAIAGAAAAHAAGCIHRDLKPSNIFLADRSGTTEAVIVDFGISKFVGIPVADGSVSAVLKGTPRYMAPEQVRGLVPSPMVDQYALGVVLYECVTGVTPFRSEDRFELQRAIVSAPLVPPSEVNPLLPRELDEIVARALSRDPSARFPSLSAFGVALLPLAGTDAEKRWRELSQRGASPTRRVPADELPARRMSDEGVGSGRRISSRGWRRERPVAPTPLGIASGDRTELEPRSPGIGEALPVQSLLRATPGSDWHGGFVRSLDGVAAIVRGDTMVMLWREPARIHRSRWVFDIADRLSERTGHSFLALMILLPTADPPDEETRRENALRMRVLAPAVRSWVNVVVGDEVKQLLARAVLRVMGRFYLRTPETAVTSSLAQGIARLRAHASPETPESFTMADDVRALCSKLGVAHNALRL